MVDETIDRDWLIAKTRENGIETTLGTYAVHAQPYFEKHYGYKAGQLPNSYQAFTKSLTLPLYPQMSEKDLDTIVEALKKIL